MTEFEASHPSPDQDIGRLQRALQDVSALKNIATAMNSTLSVEEITSAGIDHSIRRVNASQGAVFLLSEDSRGLDKCRTFIRRIDPGTNELPFSLNMELLGWMLKHKAQLISNSPTTDKRFRTVPFERLGIRSLLAVPLTSQHGLLGALVVFNKAVGEFDTDDGNFLEIVGVQTAKIIENVGLFKKEMALQQELELAQEIQQRFLPKELSAANWFDLAAINIPARQVGGDFYDFRQLDDDTLFFSIGDVSGKGIPAALIMSNAQAVFRSHLMGGSHPDLADLVNRLNRLVYEQTSAGQYLTAMYGLLHRAERRLQFVNAGHLPAMLVRNGIVTLVGEASDPIIGVLPDFQYRNQEIILSADDRLVLYTDGISECLNRGGEMYDVERLKTLLENTEIPSSKAQIESLKRSVADFREDAEQSDDITALCLCIR